MTMKKFKKTKLPHLTKDLIGNYHYGLNIEHAKSVIEKCLIVNSLLGDIPTANKRQLAVFMQAFLYIYSSQI